MHEVIVKCFRLKDDVVKVIDRILYMMLLQNILNGSLKSGRSVPKNKRSYIPLVIAVVGDKSQFRKEGLRDSLEHSSNLISYPV